ncbi:hypothetical protein SEPCBS57363_003178 [Sporothrix epigloea]|uniref:Uncharacterized protein n=1 Tax=Sporothrix epigloea TaxID=1892477 RepID=A0ABP0DK21_9PEZI
MAARRIIKSAVEKMEHLVKCAVEQQDHVVENDVKEQDLDIKFTIEKRDHVVKGAVKKQVRFFDAAAKGKDRVVEGTIKVHDYSVKDATKMRVQMVEVAVAGQGRVNKDVKKQDKTVKRVDEETDWYESLEDFRRNHSAEAVASRHYKRPGLLTIKEEDEPIYNFLEIFPKKNKYGKPITSSRLDPPVLLSPISSIASTVRPEPCLFSKCCTSIGKNARRNKRKVKRALKRLVKKVHLQTYHLRSSSLWGCIQKMQSSTSDVAVWSGASITSS